MTNHPNRGWRGKARRSVVPGPLDVRNLAEVRESFGMSKSHFSRMLGVHRNTWDKWERGEREPPAILHTALELLIALRRTSEFSVWVDRQKEKPAD